MSKKQRSLEERIQSQDELLQKTLLKAKQYEARKKQLESQKKESDRRERTHRLIEIGGAVESILGRSFVEGDVERLMNFLQRQENNGHYFSRAMNEGRE